ncbi:MAG TPA: hypothetical protein VL017_07550 [Devosia sp.]|nr:hypothetical protein [Devosia sp.]
MMDHSFRASLAAPIAALTASALLVNGAGQGDAALAAGIASAGAAR